MAIVLAGAVLAGAAYLVGPVIADWMRQVGADAGAASPSQSTPPPATPAATPAPTPAPTPTPTPAPTSVPTATPAPTATPTPSPTATPLIHVVVRGDTLTAIAARYGVTVQAIQKANRIANPSLIHVGQRLIIPPRP